MARSANATATKPNNPATAMWLPEPITQAMREHGPGPWHGVDIAVAQDSGAPVGQVSGPWAPHSVHLEQI